MRFIRFSGAFAGTVGHGGVYLKHAAKCLSGSAENPDWACNLMKSVMFLAWGGGVWWNHAVAAEFYADERQNVRVSAKTAPDKACRLERREHPYVSQCYCLVISCECSVPTQDFASSIAAS